MTSYKLLRKYMYMTAHNLISQYVFSVICQSDMIIGLSWDVKSKKIYRTEINKTPGVITI